MGDSLKWRLDEALSVPERKERVKEASMHYGKYAKSLEAAHYGEFVAIVPNGLLIVGENDIAVLKQEIEDFGRSRFIFRRICFRTMGKWRLVRGR